MKAGKRSNVCKAISADKCTRYSKICHPRANACSILALLPIWSRLVFCFVSCLVSCCVLLDLVHCLIFRFTIDSALDSWFRCALGGPAVYPSIYLCSCAHRFLLFNTLSLPYLQFTAFFSPSQVSYLFISNVASQVGRFTGGISSEQVFGLGVTCCRREVTCKG